MNKLLILYPNDFACQSKFNRKLSKITLNLETFDILHQGDAHDFIAALFTQDNRVTSIKEIDALEAAEITHAVVIDDGEEFLAERSWLEKQKIPCRWIKTPITRVVNIKREPDFQGMDNTASYEYIGRGSYWGNPHAMQGEGESRQEVIRKYQYDFEHDKFINITPSRVHELAGKRLGCFCKPAPCHGDILADYLNRYDDGQ